MRQTCEHCQQPIDGTPTMLRGAADRFFHEACSREYVVDARATLAKEKREERERLAVNEAEWLVKQRARESEAMRRAWIRQFDQSFADCCVGARLADNSDIEGWVIPGCNDDTILARRGPLNFPTWSYARFDNPEFRVRADPRMLNAFEGHGLSTSLVACGETGKAKSASAVARIWKLHDEMRARVVAGERLAMDFAWVSGFELSGARRRSPLGGESPLVSHAIGAGLLVLDEVGQEPASEETFLVLDARYRVGKPTIVTSPLAPAALAQHLGGGAFRRLLENGTLVEAFGETPKPKATVRVVR